MKFSVLLLFVWLSYCTAARILLVFHFPSPSHYILGNALAKTLAEAGHDVTIVSPYEDKKPTKNGKYKNIVLTGIDELREMKTKSNSMFDIESLSPLWQISIFNSLGNFLTEETFLHENFQALLKSNQSFDVVIVEQLLNDALKGLAYHYKAPLIVFSTIGANKLINHLVRNPEPPSYIPSAYLKYSSKMDFWDRLYNFWFGITVELIFYHKFLHDQNRIMKTYIPGVPDLDKIIYNTSLVLLNSHESTNQAVPYVPNMINIGGFHINPPKGLPKDLQEFMDNAKDGVIYFSMGSNLKPSMMPAEKKVAILNILGKLKEKVLWKWDEDNMLHQPSNVKISKWFPQQDILAHPKTKLFITHGGLLSTTETVYHGVPILALPIFADQKLNAARAVQDGYAITLPFSDINEENLLTSLKELLDNPRYQENAKYRAKLMHDRPVKPMDLAVYWTEFVIRHKGAPHLQVEGINLNWYLYLSIDVVAFSFLVWLLVFIGFVKVVSKCCRGRKVTIIKVKKS